MYLVHFKIFTVNKITFYWFKLILFLVSTEISINLHFIYYSTLKSFLINQGIHNFNSVFFSFLFDLAFLFSSKMKLDSCFLFHTISFTKCCLNATLQYFYMFFFLDLFWKFGEIGVMPYKNRNFKLYKTHKWQ